MSYINVHSKEYFGKDLEAMSFAINYHRWIIREFRPYIGKRVVEVGAGIGNFSSILLEMVESIQKLTALEPSSNMFPILKDRFKDNKRVEVKNKFFHQVAAELAGTVDTVFYINVLEHIEDDLGELRLVRDVLPPAGSLLIFVPALSWLYGGLDKRVGHYRRYHKGGLKRLVEDAGFDLVKIRYFDMLGILPWYISFVVLGKEITGGQVKLYDRLVVPVMERVESWLPAPIGKNLLVVASRP